MLQKTKVVFVIMVLLAMVVSCVDAEYPYKYRPPTTTRPTTKPTTKPAPPRTINSSQCEVMTREDLLNSSIPSGKLVCVQPSEHKLLNILKNIGGYNPNYVAMNETDARKFKDPRVFSLSPVPISTTTTKAPTTTRPPPPTTRPPYRRRRTRPYRRRRTRPTYRWRRRTRRRTRRTNRRSYWQRKRHGLRYRGDRTQFQKKESDQNNNKDEDVLVIRKRATEGVKACRDRGVLIYTESSSNVSTNRYRLCGECHVVTHLSADIRPSYINEVVCKHKIPTNTSVQEGNMCAWQSGLCIQRQVMFPAIRLTDTYQIDQKLSKDGTNMYTRSYEVQDKEIRTSCQCQVFPGTVNRLKDN